MHGARGRGAPRIAVDGEAPQKVCAVFVLDPGPHAISGFGPLAGNVEARPFVLDAAPNSVTHVLVSNLFTRPMVRPAGLVPFWHRCGKRTVAMRDGVVVWNGDPSGW